MRPHLTPEPEKKEKPNSKLTEPQTHCGYSGGCGGDPANCWQNQRTDKPETSETGQSDSSE
jgi:hypothetical protein